MLATVGALQAVNPGKCLFVKVGQLLEHFILIGPLQELFVQFLPLP